MSQGRSASGSGRRVSRYNGYSIYKVIMTGGKLSPILVAYMVSLLVKSVRLSSRNGGGGVKRWLWGLLF